jgi:hypothetical protein
MKQSHHSIAASQEWTDGWLNGLNDGPKKRAVALIPSDGLCDRSQLHAGTFLIPEVKAVWEKRICVNLRECLCTT